MTDEAQFHLNCFVNKQNPRILNEKKLHPQHVTVWCAIMCDHIIGLYFLENAEGITEIISRERYRHMLNTFL